MSKKNQKGNNTPEKKNEAPRMALDDAARVKVLSPSRLVFKRFIRNKLAIFGTCTLVILFLFCFLGPLFYPYGETQVFKGWREQNASYAYAQIRTEYVSFWDPNVDSQFKKSMSYVERNVNSTIKKMLESENEAEKLAYKIQSEEGKFYELVKLDDDTYALKDSTYTCVAEVTTVGVMINGITFSEGFENPGEDFTKAIAGALSTGSFEFDGVTYDLEKVTSGKNARYRVYCDLAASEEVYYYFVSTVLTPTFYEEADFAAYNRDSGFKYYAYLAPFTEEKSFTYDGATFQTFYEDDILGVTKNGKDCAFFSAFTATAKNAANALSAEFQLKLEEVINEMNETVAAVGTEVKFTALSPKLEEGKEVLDANGDKVMVETEYTVKREQNDYTIWRVESTYVIRIYEAPSAEHLLGTDANGMDVLARVMYGGRISLMVGFVVVFIEMILGVIMGGIAGYFGGWVDNFIMRLVDVFYCIPSMPILIITGALFDSMGTNYKIRLLWMMAILGILGWAGVARMVRGQILSLREQEFMVAAEASGLSTSRRIFRHLVPNVMPQLIVQATMGLGGVIITESTLSFLGLGVKHPLATWGNMMNNITQKVEYLQAYAYIWVPIGCLICLAVIAFNFVGDGLRDAFDPKMKR